jgi:hypothetical protein
MSHVVLLGDSIVDNRVYVSRGPDVRHQIQACLCGSWRVTLLAVAGYVRISFGRRQRLRLPRGRSSDHSGCAQ